MYTGADNAEQVCKNPAPAVSDSFVMHNRTVFVKAGKRLSAASTPKIHFAEKHPYAARTYSPNFLIDISFNFSLLQAFDYDLKSSLQLVYHKLVFQMLRYTVGYGGRRQYVIFAVYEVLDKNGAEYEKTDASTILAEMSVYGNLSRFSVCVNEREAGTELTVTMVHPCEGLSDAGIRRATTASV